MPRADGGYKMAAFTRRRDRIHEGTGFVFISDAELAEQGIVDHTRCGGQLLYNGVVHSLRGISKDGILIWKLHERGPQ